MPSFGAGTWESAGAAGKPVPGPRSDPLSPGRAMILPPDPLDDAFPLGDGVADLGATAICPYCGAEVELALDPGGGAAQEYVEDCPVCCRPWAVRVTYDHSGAATVTLETEDEA